MANHDATGHVVQILGGVVDVEFPVEDVPELYEAIEVERPGKEPLVLEVQKRLSHAVVVFAAYQDGGWVVGKIVEAADSAAGV